MCQSSHAPAGHVTLTDVEIQLTLCHLTLTACNAAATTSHAVIRCRLLLNEDGSGLWVRGAENHSPIITAIKCTAAFFSCVLVA